LFSVPVKSTDDLTDNQDPVRRHPKQQLPGWKKELAGRRVAGSFV
jgi:hypothetical protein